MRSPSWSESSQFKEETAVFAPNEHVLGFTDAVSRESSGGLGVLSGSLRQMRLESRVSWGGFVSDNGDREANRALSQGKRC